jgi:uncharacterized membrane protein
MKMREVELLLEAAPGFLHPRQGNFWGELLLVLFFAAAGCLVGAAVLLVVAASGR